MRNVEFKIIKDGQKKYKKLFHVLLFNYEDADYALYVRKNLTEAQLLAKEKMACPHVRSVQINEVVRVETPVAEYVSKMHNS